MESISIPFLKFISLWTGFDGAHKESPVHQLR